MSETYRSAEHGIPVHSREWIIARNTRRSFGRTVTALAVSIGRFDREVLVEVDDDDLGFVEVVRVDLKKWARIRGLRPGAIFGDEWEIRPNDWEIAAVARAAAPRLDAAYNRETGRLERGACRVGGAERAEEAQ